MKSAFVPEKQGQLITLGSALADIVREYYQNPEHRRQFEKWYLEKYGQKYTWKYS